MTQINSIDVAIPTYGGASVITTALQNLKQSIDATDVAINRIHLDYKANNDNTDEKVATWCELNGIDYSITESNRNLPESRAYLIGQIETDWFLFLDDDVNVQEETLSHLFDSIAPGVGAVQVRKARHTQKANGDWSKWRPVRATTFCTLFRTEAVRGCSIPSEITQLEDEYLRQYVESESDKLWLFNHQAIVDHDNQDRHDINFREGILAAKYDLLPYDYVFGNVPYNIVTWNHPLKHTKRAAGYCYGLFTK